MMISFLGKSWRWNQEDTKLIQVNSWINDLNVAMDAVAEPGASVAIQAGGAMGVWPWVMSKEFHHVYTFEPDRENFACLSTNLEDRTNVTPIRGALSDHMGYGEVKLPPSEISNAGAYYIKEVKEGIPSPGAEKVPVYRLDDLVASGDIVGPVGLIQLDIEGLELKALKGARKLIETNQPVIMIEEKALPQDRETGHRVGASERWLVDVMGYKLHASIHRDLIFVPGK